MSTLTTRTNAELTARLSEQRGYYPALNEALTRLELTPEYRRRKTETEAHWLRHVVVKFPAGATHYWGDLFEDPEWVKSREIAGVAHWFNWSSKKREWMVYSETKPHWLKEIP